MEGSTGLDNLHPTAVTRRLSSRPLPVLDPFINGASDHRSLLDQTRSPDFRERIPDTIDDRCPNDPKGPPVVWLSTAISRVASASVCFVASDRQVCPDRSTSRIRSAPWLLPETNIEWTSAIRGSECSRAFRFDLFDIVTNRQTVMVIGFMISPVEYVARGGREFSMVIQAVAKASRQ